MGCEMSMEDVFGYIEWKQEGNLVILYYVLKYWCIYNSVTVCD